MEKGKVIIFYFSNQSTKHLGTYIDKDFVQIETHIPSNIHHMDEQTYAEPRILGNANK